jgi:CBS domain-containing protein
MYVSKKTYFYKFLIKINNFDTNMCSFNLIEFKLRRANMHNTQVKELMTEKPTIISKKATLQDAAEMMEAIDCGFLPVGTADRLEGIITDRDIVIRAIAKGKSPSEELVKDYMTVAAYGCNEDDFLEDAADKMKEHKISRLVVRNHQGNVTGVLSFGGILRKNADADEVANVVKHAIHRSAI